MIKLKIISSDFCYSDSLRLKLIDTENKLNFFAGQFITLVLTKNGQKLFKSFSIASAPSELPYIELFFRRSDDEFTNTLVNLQTGSFIPALPPDGKLTLLLSTKNNVVFIAMGSGITPFMSIIKDEFHNKKNRKLFLFYGNRNYESAYFIEEIQRFDEEEKIKLSNYFTHETKYQKVKHCRLNPNVFIKDFEDLGINLSDCDFYLCGSSEFVSEFVNFLSTQNLDGNQIHFEIYDYEKVKRDVENFVIKNGKGSQ